MVNVTPFLALLSAASLATAHLAIRSALPSRWSPHSRADPSAQISLTIALTIPNTDIAAAHLANISSPDSPSYNQHWTRAQINELLRPPSSVVEAVLRWLDESGISGSRVRRRGSAELRLDITVSEAEVLLSTECHYYKTPGASENLTFPAFQRYDIPRAVTSHIHYILPNLPNLPLPKPAPVRSAPPHLHTHPKRKRHTIDRPCLTHTTPTCLRTLYNVPSTLSPSHPNNTYGIFQPSWITWRPSDLDAFFAIHHPTLVGHRPAMVPINGGYQTDEDNDAWNLEPNLDFQYAMSLAYPLPVSNIQVGSREYMGTFNVMFSAFDSSYCDALDPEFDNFPPEDYDCGTLDPPHVISISYSWNELDFPKEYLERQCLEFLKLGLQGVTVLASSGDSGVASHFDSTCLDDKGVLGDEGARGFVPTWPAACPWVTAVGGTKLEEVDEDTIAWRNHPSTGVPPAEVREVVYSRQIGNRTRSSGGGFSRVFPAPEYQSDIVAKYLSDEAFHITSFKTSFNGSNRGYPDLSILATSYQAVSNGKTTSIYGTSASAPVFGAIITKINDERLRAGKGPVGFVNSVMYANPGAFNDVVQGANAGCGIEGFRAREGWDAATGLGSPDFGRLRDVFMALP